MKRGALIILLIVIVIAILAIPVLMPVASEWLLRHAVENSSPREIRFLTMLGVDINGSVDDGGKTPLHLAAERGDKKIFKYLLMQGADINARYADGVTVLDEAQDHEQKEIVEVIHRKLGSIYDFCAVGDLEKVRELLKIDPSLVNKSQSFTGQKPLHIAAENGQELMTELLIRSGADVNARNGGNDTPLHLAATTDVAKVLLKHGADIDAKSCFFVTPLRAARSSGRLDVTKFLKSRGGHEYSESGRRL